MPIEAEPGAADDTMRTDIAWARLSPLLDQALDQPEAGRGAWLAALRAQSPDEARAVERLLAHHDSAGREGFLQAAAVAAGGPPASVHARRFGPWAVEAQLGEGGMGSVWLARRSDGRFDGQAAIKLMHGRLQGSQAVQRFEREGRILARLQHPHIARLLDAGVASEGDGGQPYLVLELVRGQAIDRWCDGQRLGVEARLRLFVDVAEAVAAAHAQLVVHRDLKPGNVMVDTQGQVKLLDFGIAKLIEGEGEGASEGGTTPDAQDALTQTGQRAFTPGWAAPEQVRGEPIGTAADVWSLGVLLCLLLTGRHPSGLAWGSDVAAWLRATAEARVLRPSRLVETDDAAAEQAERRATTPERLARRLQGELDQIAQRALADEPARRYPSAQTLADDVRRHLRHEPITAHADTRGYRAAKSARRNRLVVGAASTTLLALVAGVLGTTWQALEAQRQRDAARGAQAEAVAQAARADEQRTQALASAIEAQQQRVVAEGARERALSEATRAEVENRRAVAAQALAQAEAAAARRARAETDAQLAQTQAQRAEARYAARASAASVDMLSALLADIGNGGKPLQPAQLIDRARELVEKSYVAAPALQSELYIGLGVRYQQLRLSDRQREMRELGEAAARRSGDGNALVNALCAAVEPDVNQGRTAQVQQRLDEARGLMAALGPQARLSMRLACLNVEIFLASARGSHGQAIGLAQQAIKLLEDDDQREGPLYITAMGNLAFQHQRAAQPAEALAIYVKLGELMDATGRSHTADRLTVMANIGIQQSTFGEYRDAMDTLAETLRRAVGTNLSEPAGDPGLARSYGVTLFHMHRYEAAARWLEYAWQSARQSGAVPIQLDACSTLARTLVHAGNLNQADRVLQGCSETLAGSAARSPSQEIGIERTRAEWHLARGDAAAAQLLLRRLGASIPAAPSPANDRARIGHLPLAVRTAVVTDELVEARTQAEIYLASAERLARRPEHGAHVGRAWALLGAVQQRQGQPREAQASWQRALPILRAAMGADHPEAAALQAMLAQRPP